MRGWRLVPFLLASCTLLTQFDPEGQPCDPDQTQPELQCLSDAGYWCVNKLCKKGAGPRDAGPSADAGFDAGMKDGAIADAGVADGGGPDGGVSDSGIKDAGQPDGGNIGG